LSYKTYPLQARAQHKKVAKQKRMSNIEQGIMNVEGRNVANLILNGV
jgi:hypothetical protein